MSMLAFESGGLVCVLILTGGRWASALAGRTGTWLSKPRPSPALPAAWCSHGLAVFCTKHTHRYNINTIINPSVKSTDTEKVMTHVIEQKLELPPRSWMPPPVVVVVYKSMFVQLVYLVKTYEFNKRIECIFGEMQIITTLLSMIPVNNFQ